jgi:hypothetical protein
VSAGCLKLDENVKVIRASFSVDFRSFQSLPFPLVELDRRTDDNGTLSDHGAVSLVDDVVDELELVRVRDDLVIGEDVLSQHGEGGDTGGVQEGEAQKKSRQWRGVVAADGQGMVRPGQGTRVVTIIPCR